MGREQALGFGLVYLRCGDRRVRMVLESAVELGKEVRARVEKKNVVVHQQRVLGADVRRSGEPRREGVGEGVDWQKRQLPAEPSSRLTQERLVSLGVVPERRWVRVNHAYSGGESLRQMPQLVQRTRHRILCPDDHCDVLGEAHILDERIARLDGAGHRRCQHIAHEPGHEWDAQHQRDYHPAHGEADAHFWRRLVGFPPSVGPAAPGGRAPLKMSDEDDIYNVNEGWMLQMRRTVMVMCCTQIGLSLSLASIGAMRRTPALLVMQPFFVLAGLFGFLGAHECKPWLISFHFVGSSGLSLVLGFFIIAECFLKEEGADLLFFALNGPMDLFMAAGSFFSLTLWRALIRLRQELHLRREARRAQTAHVEERLRELGTSAARSRSIVSASAAEAAERRMLEAESGLSADASTDARGAALLRDLRCPITMDIMMDPVIAADGHSYERAAVERWFLTHRTSPMTGAVLTSSVVMPNHRLRTIIADLGELI